MLAAGVRADELGFYSLWTWDHLYPIVGSDDGPMFEGYLDARRLGAGDQAHPGGADGRGQPVPQPGARGQDGHAARPHQRRPSISGHRLGVERDRGEGVRHRVWRVARGAAALAARGAAGDARHAPRRASRRPPDRATARTACATTRRRCREHCRCSSAAAATTSRCASSRATATRTTSASRPATRRSSRKEAALRRHCEEVGRDHREIERTLNTGPVLIRDSQEEALRVLEQTYEHNGGAETWAGRPASAQPTGSPEHLRRAAHAVCRGGLPPHRLRLPGAVRRGDHGAPDRRGHAQAGGCRSSRLRRTGHA